MPSITFNPELHHRQNEKGLHSIMIRMTQNRRHKRKELGYEIEKRHWNIKKKQVRSSHPLHAIINAAIKTKIQELEKEYLKSIPLETAPSMHDIANKATRDILGGDFLKFYKSYLLTVKNAATRTSMTSTFNKLAKYKSMVNFGEIDSKFIENYRLYLSTLGNNNTTISLDFSYLRIVFNAALKSGTFIPSGPSPFLNLNIKKEKFKRTKLTVEDIQALENLEIPSSKQSLIHARNIFLLCYYLMGIRVSSMLKMRWENIVGDRCIYAAAKGEKSMNARIGTKAQAILNFYRQDGQKPTDFIFPYIPQGTIINLTDKQSSETIKNKTRRINERLEVLSNLLGIDKRISMHVARSSFAYNARKLSDGDVYAVQKALGHSSISVTERYFSSDETIEADNLSNLMFD